MIAFISFYNIFVRKFCISLPLKCLSTSSQSGVSVYLPRLGLILLANICKAVDLPIPLVPTNPNTYPALGIGSLCNLNELAPNLWVVSLLRFLGRFMILRAPNGHFLTQRPQPMQRGSARDTTLEVELTSIHNLSALLTGHTFLHS